MNSPQQVAAVKEIISFKNRILHSSNWDEITALMQSAIDAAVNVPAHPSLNALDKTKSREWNIISIQRLIKAAKEGYFNDPESAFPEIATALLRLAMVFVKNGLEDVNKILASSLLNKGFMATSKQKTAGRRS